MPLDQLLAAWKPRLEGRGFVDVLHSHELTTKLQAEFVAMGCPKDVASLAAGSVVNMQGEPRFGLVGTHNSDPFRASAALRAIDAWIVVKTMREAA